MRNEPPAPPQAIYSSYLLRIWQVTEAERPVWRIALEPIGPRERRLFEHPAELAAFLQDERNEAATMPQE